MVPPGMVRAPGDGAPPGMVPGTCRRGTCRPVPRGTVPDTCRPGMVRAPGGGRRPCPPGMVRALLGWCSGDGVRGWCQVPVVPARGWCPGMVPGTCLRPVPVCGPTCWCVPGTCGVGPTCWCVPGTCGVVRSRLGTCWVPPAPTRGGRLPGSRHQCPPSDVCCFLSPTPSLAFARSARCQSTWHVLPVHLPAVHLPPVRLRQRHGPRRSSETALTRRRGPWR
jgi:hypothetical protein